MRRFALLCVCTAFVSAVLSYLYYHTPVFDKPRTTHFDFSKNAENLLQTSVLVSAYDLTSATPEGTSGAKSGSGVLFYHNKRVYVLTAYHVIASDKFGIESVLLSVNRRAGADSRVSDFLSTAEFVCGDADMDYAVVQVKLPNQEIVDAAKKTTITSFKSSDFLVGKKVMHVGNCSGTVNTFSVGYIGNASRDHLSMSSGKPVGTFIQTSALVGGFGSSGGGVFDENEGLIGIMVSINVNPPFVCYVVPIWEIIEHVKQHSTGIAMFD